MLERERFPASFAGGVALQNDRKSRHPNTLHFEPGSDRKRNPKYGRNNRGSEYGKPLFWGQRIRKQSGCKCRSAPTNWTCSHQRRLLLDNTFFGYPANYTDATTGAFVGDLGTPPIAVFLPVGGAASVGVAELALAPTGFPNGLNDGIFAGFDGDFNHARWALNRHQSRNLL